jgi:putative ABC transport system permease protein
MTVVLELAISALRHRPMRTFLTASGIAIAVGSMVIFLSLGEGLRQAFASEIGSVGAEIQVSYGSFENFSGEPELPLARADDLRAVADEYGIISVTPLYLYFRGGFSPDSSFAFQGVPTDVDLTGIYPGFEILEGRGLMPTDRDRNVAVVGEQVAERSNLQVGGTLRLSSDASFEIIGISSSAGGFLGNAIVTPLVSLQEATNAGGNVTFFVVDIADPAAATSTASALAERFPELGFQTQSDVLEVIERGIRITDVVRLGISVIALIVGAIAVANTVLMSVIERTREFGVVRAVGARPRFLFALVLAESVALSIIGGAAGVALGFGGAAVVNVIAVDLIGLNVAAVTARLVAFSFAVAFIMGVLSGLAPSARAARIRIAEATSYGV